MVESFVSGSDKRLVERPLPLCGVFDGTNVAPPLFCAFVITTMLFGGRFGSMGLFPYQPTIDYAFKYSQSLVMLFVDPHFVRPERYLGKPPCSVCTFRPFPYGCIFFPQQVLFTLALSFRRKCRFLRYSQGQLF